LGVDTNGKSEQRGQIRAMYFMYLYGNRTIKPVEIVLSRGRG
jgi:hypothetical protein